MEKKYIYIIKTEHRGSVVDFDYFKTKEEAEKFIIENQGTMVEEYEMERDTHYNYTLFSFEVDEENEVTFENIRNIGKNGRIYFYNSYDEDDNEYIQPIFAEDYNADYKQEYSEFYYYKTDDGKYSDNYDDYNSENEIKNDYFNLYTL